MLFLQLRQAEIAIADGRLDEAYRLIQPESLRNHRRGQTLVTQLIEKLVDRGQRHLAEGHATHAMTDVLKAEQLGGNLENVADLRRKIESIVVSEDQNRRHQAQAGRIDQAAQRVHSALGRKDIDRAVAELVRARGNGAEDSRLREFDADVRATLESRIRDCLTQGRFDQVDPLMDRLTRLDPAGLATVELSRIASQLKNAWSSISAGQIDDALDTLRRMAIQLPDADWIDDATAHLVRAAEALRAIRTSCLGLMMSDSEPIRDERPLPAERIMQGRDARVTGEPSPGKFILQVDGAGSYLVVTKSLVSLGPISSSKMPDVALITDAGANMVNIERVEDDYFLRTPGSAGKLLSSGERIALSPRCKLEFTIPNSSSTSATLELSTGRFPRADVRKVILLDSDLIIGPGRNSHIRLDHLEQPLVLQLRDGKLWQRNRPLETGKPLNLAGAGIMVSPLA